MDWRANKISIRITINFRIGYQNNKLKMRMESKQKSPYKSTKWVAFGDPRPFFSTREFQMQIDGQDYKGVSEKLQSIPRIDEVKSLHLVVKNLAQLNKKLDKTQVKLLTSFLKSHLLTIKTLRLTLIHALSIENPFIDLALALSQISTIKSIEIISESSPQQDQSINWTYFTKPRPTIHKLITLATVTIKEQCRLDIEKRNRMEHTVATDDYRTQIDLDLLKEVPHLSSWRCHNLSMHTLKLNQIFFASESFFSYLSGCQFPYLSIIDISGNEIESVEQICSLMAPNLEKLTIQRNHITILKSLRKMYSKKIQTIDTQNNLVNEIGEQVQGSWPMLQTLCADMVSSFKPLLKLQANIEIGNMKKMALEPLIEKMLEKKSQLNKISKYG